jgi:MoxR-like ATPase
MGQTQMRIALFTLLPIFLIGMAGIGKTACAKAIEVGT